MAEDQASVIAQECFELLPIAGVVTHLVASRADRQELAEAPAMAAPTSCPAPFMGSMIQVGL